jgi:16S rRNA (cytosine1402-N4)-methyltransferase
VTHAWEHLSVLLSQAVEALQVDAEGRYVDATFGRGGHARRILQALGPRGRLLAFDKDPQAVESAQQLALSDPRFSICHRGFSHIDSLEPASVDGLLMDLGVSSPQIDDPQRGFSFRHDGPLDMRMDTLRGHSVAQWLEQASVQQIAEVIRDYGEERFAGPIAKAIDRRRREHGPLVRTAELAQVVAGAVKTREPGKDPATRTFQAFRIFINAELEELRQALEASLRILRPRGRLVVISFHSLEDRIVKQFMAHQARQVYDRRVPMAAAQPVRLKLCGRVMPSQEEIALNPRARSAVMRVAERTEVA